MFGGADERYNKVSTDEFLFHYGSVAVFPGLRDEAFYIGACSRGPYCTRAGGSVLSYSGAYPPNAGDPGAQRRARRN